MAIISKTKLKILKELAKNPAHGYVLAKKLNITISSIYAHLSELEKAGLITCEVSKRRKIYHLARKGKRLLEFDLKISISLRNVWYFSLCKNIWI